MPAASGGVAEEDIAPAIKQTNPAYVRDASRLFEEEEAKDVVTQQALIPEQPSDQSYMGVQAAAIPHAEERAITCNNQVEGSSAVTGILGRQEGGQRRDSIPEGN